MLKDQKLNNNKTKHAQEEYLEQEVVSGIHHKATKRMEW